MDVLEVDLVAFLAEDRPPPFDEFFLDDVPEEPLPSSKLLSILAIEDDEKKETLQDEDSSTLEAATIGV